MSTSTEIKQMLNQFLLTKFPELDEDERLHCILNCQVEQKLLQTEPARYGRAYTLTVSYTFTEPVLKDDTTTSPIHDWKVA